MKIDLDTTDIDRRFWRQVKEEKKLYHRRRRTKLGFFGRVRAWLLDSLLY